MTDAHSRTPALRWTLQAEGLGIAALCIWLYGQTGASWWLFGATLLGPDLFMLGYLAGNRTGALCYNLGHSYLAPLALAAGGTLMGVELPLSLALVWGAHIGLDRAMGYGLKYAAGFLQTHLGRI